MLKLWALLRALLFDLDGTLIDSVRSRNIHERIWKEIVFLSSYRMKTPWLWKRIEYTEARLGWPCHPVVPELAVAIRAFRSPPQRVVGVVTNRGAFSAYRLFERIPLSLEDLDYIHTTQGLGDHRISMPITHISHPHFKNADTFTRILKLLAETHGIAPGEVAYVDDDVSGYLASREAGIRYFFASTWGRSQAEEFKAEGLPDEFILGSRKDLARLLRL